LVSHQVLVSEAYNPITISILRSLARKGIDTVVLTNHRVSLSTFSKHGKNQILVPSPAIQNQYVDAVEKIVRKMHFEILFPVLDLSLIPISKNRDRLAKYVKLPIPPYESMVKCFDKSATIKLARESGVPVPRTYFVHNDMELKNLSKEITYPTVVKPRWSISWSRDNAFQRRCAYVGSAKELFLTYESINEYFPFPFVQEYVQGTNYSVAALCNEGRPRAYCCIKVHRAWPPTGGNSSFRESAKLDPKMRAYTEILLKNLNYHGIAEVEFRLDSRDNIPKLMEINPRFWGSLEVAMRAGVDFPYLLYRMTMDDDVNTVSDYEVGVKGRYLGQDMYYVISLLTDALPSPSILRPHRLHAMLKWLKFYEPRTFYDMLCKDDPVPFLFSFAIQSPVGIMRLLRRRRYAWSSPRPA